MSDQDTTIRPVTQMHQPGNGPAVRICDMSDSHLLATVKRLHYSHRKALYVLEARRRGLPEVAK